MSFFYADGGNYKEHKNPEGVLKAENRAWHEANHTYEFAYGLGTVIVLYGLLLCLHPGLPQAAVGSFLLFVMSFVTLSFLVTTPECWVPALGDAQHRFPYLSGAGRLPEHLGELRRVAASSGNDRPVCHTAILYPTRRALAVALRRVQDAGIQLDGASDHGVSEALSLRDPDDHGVELYWDHPQEAWPRTP